MSNENKKDTRSATQRLADLETAVSGLYNLADRITKDLLTLRDGLNLIDNKVNSIIKLSASGDFVTVDTVSKTMLDNNCEALAAKVAGMVEQGIIVAETEVSENSFIVGNESDNDGKVVNPRLQFALKALAPAIQEKFKGAKAGDTLNLEEGKLRFTILESYSIQEQSVAPEVVSEQVAPEAEATAPVAEVPATEQTDQAVTA